MKKSKKRRKSNVNDAYLIVIAICSLSLVIAIKQIIISISTLLSNLSSSIQLSLIVFATISVTLVLYLKTKHINFLNKNRHKLLSSVNYMSLSTYEFEQFCAEVLNRLGDHIKVLPPKNDGGKDLIGTDPNKQKSYGECKQWTSSNIGRPAMQKLKGSMVDANVNTGICFT